MWRFMAVTFAFLGWAFYVMSGGSDYAPADNSLQAKAAQEALKAEEVTVATIEPAATGSTEDDTGIAQAAASIAELSEAEASEERFQITLASVSGSNEYDDATLPETVAAVPVETISSAIDAAVEEANAEVAAATEAAELAALEAAEQEEAALNTVVGGEVFSLETYVQAQQNNIQVSYAGETNEASSTGVARSYSEDIRTVTGNVVNMRAGPGTNYEAVGKLNRGAEVAVIDEPGNGWIMFEVLETGETAWMADWLVTASN